ncbi:MAG: hypothetical protein H6855_01175 [Rhodospirillales bacterium]|nr:hypothetical protein [Rhodospirillales bacterium]MCB9964681.1 hypothetical protein [Rhodospirillales bacterium]MCB9979971.1 hypothetical protein [Rhodospirillales bacterium]
MTTIYALTKHTDLARFEGALEEVLGGATRFAGSGSGDSLSIQREEGVGPATPGTSSDLKFFF